MQPDISEPRQDKEKRATKPDPLATRPALAVSWHMPVRNTPEYYAMGLVNKILVQGKDSRLYQALVQEKGLTGDVAGGINLLGDQFNISGPTALDVYLFHDKDKSADQILEAIDAEVAKLQNAPVDGATLDRAMVKMRSSLYDAVDDFFGFGRADLLASFALFDDDPSRINRLEAEFAKVTPELIQKAAKEYLRSTNRTVLLIDPKKAGGGVSAMPTPRRRKAEASDDGPHRRPHPGPAGPRGGAVRRPRARQGHASAARRAEGFQAARAGAPDPPERDEGHAGRLGQHAQGRARAVHPGRQCRTRRPTRSGWPT